MGLASDAIFSHHRDTDGHSNWSHITTRLRAVCVWRENISHYRNCYFITFPASPMVKSSTILNPSCVNFVRKVAPLDATPYINTSDSEQISVCSVWSNGTIQSCCARRFGCLEFEVPLAPIFCLTLLTREPDQSGSRSRLHCNRQMAPQIERIPFPLGDDSSQYIYWHFATIFSEFDQEKVFLRIWWSRVESWRWTKDGFGYVVSMITSEYWIYLDIIVAVD